MENKTSQVSVITRQAKRRGRRQSGSLPQHLGSAFLVALLVIVVVVVVILATIQLVDAHSLLPSDNAAGDPHQGGTGISSGRQQNGRSMGAANQAGGAANQNRCQSGWMWFNNKCWVTTHSRRDFAHAAEMCRKMYNSTLPTIHSDEENEFLRQNIELTNSPIWLFARHNHQYNKTRWLDKTAVNYTRWDVGQPSDKSSLVCIKTEDSWYMKKAEPIDGQTECVSFWEDAKWGTQVGCQVLLPVVCEKKLTPISRYNQDGANGPNGTISSQFEQQQMYNPISGSSSLLTGNSGQLLAKSIYTITLLISVLLVSF